MVALRTISPSQEGVFGRRTTNIEWGVPVVQPVGGVSGH